MTQTSTAAAARTSFTISGFTIQTISLAEVRAEAVAHWGEAKVAANEVDVARRFAHLRA